MKIKSSILLIVFLLCTPPVLGIEIGETSLNFASNKNVHSIMHVLIPQKGDGADSVKHELTKAAQKFADLATGVLPTFIATPTSRRLKIPKVAQSLDQLTYFVMFFLDEASAGTYWIKSDIISGKQKKQQTSEVVNVKRFVQQELPIPNESGNTETTISLTRIVEESAEQALETINEPTYVNADECFADRDRILLEYQRQYSSRFIFWVTCHPINLGAFAQVHYIE